MAHTDTKDPPQMVQIWLPLAISSQQPWTVSEKRSTNNNYQSQLELCWAQGGCTLIKRPQRRKETSYFRTALPDEQLWESCSSDCQTHPSALLSMNVLSSPWSFSWLEGTFHQHIFFKSSCILREDLVCCVCILFHVAAIGNVTWSGCTRSKLHLWSVQQPMIHL